MRASETSAAVLVSALAAWAGLVAVPGCGPSELARAHDAYVAVVEPRLDREAEIWKRYADLAESSEGVPIPRGYYEFLEGELRPFYLELHAGLKQVEPGHDRLARAHRMLLRFAEARVEFIQYELAAREVNEAATAPGEGLAPFLEIVARAEQANNDYARALGLGTPDAKFTALSQTVTSFEQGYVQGLVTGRAKAADAEDELKRRVLPTLRDLRGRKYGDDEAERTLKRCVMLWLEAHEELAARLPLLAQVTEASSRWKRALDASLLHMQEFQREMKSIRADR